METFMLNPVGNTILLILYVVQFIVGILLFIKAIKMPNSTQQPINENMNKTMGVTGSRDFYHKS